MKAISIIRSRGQLTIPDSIRKTIHWIRPLSAITISVVKPDEIVINPHKAHLDWDKLWKGIKRSRAIKGKGKITSAAEFIELDRNSH